MNARRLVLVCLFAVCFAFPARSALGKTPAKKSSLAELHRALADERYAEGKQCADAILRQGEPGERAKAALCYGRILLSLNRQAEARQYLGMMAKQPLDENSRQLMAVYQAWLDASGPKPDEAIARLEAVLKAQSPLESTADAADALAIVHLQRAETDKAKAAVEAGLAFLKYRNLKTPYVGKLLRGRLGGGAKKLFDRAEKLRQEKKLADAGKIYLQVCQLYPQSEWAAPAGYRAGLCLKDLGLAAEAEAHFTAFVNQSAAGPWRGQARAALIDLALEQRRDLAAATEQAKAATAVLEKGVDKGAKESWDKAAFDIHVRQGVLSLIQSRRDGAIKALKAAEAVAPREPESLRRGLVRVKVLAANKSPLAPSELGDNTNPETVLISAGRVYNLLGLPDRAAAVLESLLTGKTRSYSRPHRSFAALESARAQAALDQTDGARNLYLRSLQEDPKARWHDDTLRELALLIERMADERAVAKWTKIAETKAAHSPASPPTGKSPGKAPVAPSADSVAKKSESAEPSRHDVAWDAAVARAAALPYWTRLLDEYPKSPRVPEALYHVGKLHAEGNKPSPDKALAAFEQLVERFPSGPWTGDAHVWLFDVKLEAQLDLDAAEAQIGKAIRWLDQLNESEITDAQAALHAVVRTGLEQGVAPSPDVAPSLDNDAQTNLRTVRQAKYDIYLRAGLLKYLKQQPKQAAAFFTKAKPFAPPRDFIVVHGTIPTGIERLISAAETNKSLTPDAVLTGDPTAKLCLMLADIYHEAEQWDKSFELCNRLLHGAVARPTKEQRSWAYFKRGRNYYCFESEPRNNKKRGEPGAASDAPMYFSPDAALADYVAAVKTAPHTDWADNAMFLAASILWNHYQDADQAVAIWQHLLRKYPKSEEADRSAFLVGVVNEWKGRNKESIATFKAFLVVFPKSRFASDARERLKKLETATGDTKSDDASTRQSK